MNCYSRRANETSHPQVDATVKPLLVSFWGAFATLNLKLFRQQTLVTVAC